MLFFMMCLSPRPFLCIFIPSCLFLWHVDLSLSPPHGPLTPPFPFISFCPWLKISWRLHETSLMCSISSITCNLAPSTVLTHILSLLHLYFSISSSSSCLMLGPVCTGGDGQSGGRAGQAQGKSSSSLGGTSSWQGLRPPCVPAVCTVPSPQQFNQGNTAPTL